MKHHSILLLQLCLCLMAMLAEPMQASDTIIVEQIQICPTQTIIYRGIEIAKEGVYFDTLISQTGQPDSIYRIVVNEAPSYYYRDTITLPKNQTITWHGQTYKSVGTYYDYQRTILGCDSIYELTLRNPIVYQHHDKAGICRQDLPYLYKGEAFYDTGDYEVTRTSAKGMDSVFSLHLTVYETTERTMQREICEGETVLFRGQKLSEPGRYTDTLVSAHGCDSIVHLVLNTGSTYMVEQLENICLGDSFLFYGQWLLEEGVYSHTTQTVHGCDSTIKLILNMVPRCETTHVVHLCPGESYSFKGVELTQTGEYTDTLISAAGCDSIVRVRLTVQNTVPRSSMTLLTCKDEPVHYNGIPYYAPTSFTDTLLSANGCDSLLTVIIQAAPNFLFQEKGSLSETPYLWRGKQLTRPGIYYDSLRTVYGCDSVYELTLCQNDLRTIHLYACQGDSLHYRNQVFTQSSVYYDTLTNRYGCDSLLQVVMHFAQSYRFVENKYICCGETYTWRGQTCYKEGSYFDTLPTIHGCDSIFELRLTVGKPQWDSVEVVVCENELPYRWQGRNYFQTGFYTDSLRTVKGCDSILTLHLVVKPTYLFVEYHDICQGDYILVNDSMVSESGIFDKVYASEGGCDSIYRTIVNMRAIDTIYQKATICSNEQYLWRNQVLTMPKVYIDRLPYSGDNFASCDSVVYMLELEVLDSQNEQTEVVLCADSLPYLWRERTFWTDTLVADTFVNALGCDSIFTLQLTVARCSDFDTLYLCKDATLKVDGIIYDSLGDYRNQVGADTIHRFVIVRGDSALTRLDTTICSSQMPIWLGTVRVFEDQIRTDTVNIVREHLNTIHGCDSIIEWHLTVIPSHIVTKQVRICNDDFYSFRGQELTRSGVYYDTLYNVLGCDSIVRLVLTRVETAFVDEKAELNYGGTYLWHGRELNTNGIYYDTIRSVELPDCDSIVYRLYLTVHEGYRFYDTVHVCSNQLPYLWKGEVLDSTGLYEHRYRSIQGADSVYSLLLFVDSAYLRTEYLTTCSGRAYTYYDTLTTLFGCDSIVRYVVNRATPSPLTIRTVATCEGEPYYLRGKQYNPPCVIYDTLLNSQGCDSVVRYVVNAYPSFSMDRYDTIIEGQTVLFDGQQLHLPGTYVKREKTVLHGCDSIVRLHLYVYYHTFREDTVTMCYDSPDFPYIHHGREYRTSTLFKDTTLNPLGYYDIVWTHLLVYPRIPETVIQLSLCNDDVLQIRGQVIDQPGNYYDTLASKRGGCDSIIHYIVRKGQTYYIQQRDSFCLNEGYVWRGHKNDTILRYTGVYYDRLLSTAGCDSIYELTLYGKPVYYYDTTVLVCPDEFPINHNGHLYYEATIISDTMKSKSCSCDSIRRVHYQLTNKCSDIDHVYRCVGETLHLGNTDIQQAGYYRFEEWTRFGLDSVYRVRIDSAYPSFDTLYAAICQGDSILFGSDYISTPGTHRFINDNRFGCDSLTVLNLTVHQRNYAEANRINVADYELPYIWRNQPYLVSGNYEDFTYDLKKGCIDSVYRLQLNVIPTIYDTLSYTICHGDSVQYNRQWYYRTTALMDTLHDMQTGRSAITLFDLHVVDSTRINSIDVITDCADADDVVLRTRYSGAAPQTYSLRFLDDKAYQRGFTDQLNQPFTQQIAIPIPLHTGTAYTQPDIYRFRITYYSGTCGTVAHDADFTLRYPSWIMEQNWDHMIALLNENYNGGYRFTAYRWSIPKKNITGTDPYFYSPLMTAGDTVIVALSVNGIDYIESCPFVVQSFKNIYHNQPIIVYPTAAPARQAVVQVQSEQTGTWTLLDTNGRILDAGTLEVGTQAVRMPDISGCYLILIHTQDGQTTTRKILLY